MHKSWSRKPRPFNFKLLKISYRKTLFKKIDRKTKIAGECKLWTGGTNSSGYPQMRIQDPVSGCWLTLSVHRIVFGLETGNELGDRGFHVSHLCHNKKCIHVGHLSYETASTNDQRSECIQSNECEGHDFGPDCLLECE
jgi:hypothetical protein